MVTFKFPPMNILLARYTPAQQKVIIRNFRIGRKIEREHTNSQKVADRIALNHLIDEGMFDYYDHLIPLEKKLKKEWKK